MSCEIYKVLDHLDGQTKLVPALEEQQELLDVIYHESDDPDLAIEQLEMEVDLGEQCETRSFGDLL